MAKEITHSKPLITDTDKTAVIDVLTKNLISEGSLNDKFEKQVSKYLKLFGGVSTNNGTTALILALKSLDLISTDEVILPSYVCKSVYDAVKFVGCEPVFCDIGEDWCVNVHTINKVLTPKTKAIIVVHTFGIVADVEPIINLGIPVIEDCCQAFGAKRNGKLAGTYGVLCVLSFQATKCLTTGEGGMVLTNNKYRFDKLRSIKYGYHEKHAIRLKTSLSDLQAALGLSQLKQYNKFLKKRKEIANVYFSKFKNLNIKLPTNIIDHSIFYRFPILAKNDFGVLKQNFSRYGIHIRKGVDIMLHQELGYPLILNKTEQLFKETISIPIYPALTTAEVERICNVSKTVLLSP